MWQHPILCVSYFRNVRRRRVQVLSVNKPISGLSRLCLWSFSVSISLRSIVIPSLLANTQVFPIFVSWLVGPVYDASSLQSGPYEEVYALIGLQIR